MSLVKDGARLYVGDKVTDDWKDAFWKGHIATVKKFAGGEAMVKEN